MDDKSIIKMAARTNSGVVLCGQHEKTFVMALKMARAMMCRKQGKENCDCRSCSMDIEKHPDIEIVEKKGRSVGIGQVRTISLGTRPTVGRRKVVIVMDFGAMTEEAQNAILKVTEEDADRLAVIGLYETGNLLPTIRSRMNIIDLPRITEEEYNRNHDVDHKKYLCSGGGENINPCFPGVYDAVISHSGGDFMRSLHALKENDSGDFFRVYGPEGVKQLASFISRICAENMTLTNLKIILLCGEEEEKALDSSYAKGDWQLFACEIANLLIGD